MTISQEDRATLVRLRLEQMHTAARSCRVLLEAGDLQGAATRLFYSVFYAISAAALMREKSFSKHGALIGWFTREFVATGIIDRSYGRFINSAWKNRTRGDNQYIVNLTSEELIDSVNTLDTFIDSIYAMLKEVR